MYVCMYVRMYVCMYVYVRMCVQAHVCVPQVHTILESGHLETWNLLTRNIAHTSDLGEGKLQIVGFDLFRQSGLQTRRFITCTSSGRVVVRQQGAGDHVFKVGEQVYRMRLERQSENQIATGGKENFLKVWDTTTGQKTWQCKNVAHDDLNLRVPFWINDLAFSPLDATRILTGTAHHEIKLYDTQASKRPVMDLPFGKAAITSLGYAVDGNSIFAGDGAGNLKRIDLRVKRVIGGYHGIAGSVRSLHVHPTLPFLAACGMDRHARVFNINSRALVPPKS
jgi:ribosome biogenesis protein NSA1